MKQLAQTTQHTSATPNAVFSLWADVNNWADYDKGIEWAKLDTPFGIGGTYTLKPKGGPKVKANIIAVVQDKVFTDVSNLPGAKLKFEHTIEKVADGSNVKLVMTISGPLSFLWAKILGKNQQADLEKSTAALLAKAEGKS